MKKVISIALFVSVFGLVGCSAQDNPDRTSQRDYKVSSAGHRAKCVGGKCPSGKFGVGQRTGDRYK